ncbi:MAG TPA: TetR/AcrR family transcriptional regulator [Stellaceae bacterium]|jgi:AcrR family transcriptional regulator
MTDLTPSTRWRRRKGARPAEILAAALASFAERGFAATRLDDVAARAGVTKGTLYLYFRNKEELFEAVVRQELVPNLARAEAIVAGSKAPNLVLLHELVGLFSQVMRSPLGAIPKLVLTEAGNFPDLARFYSDEVVDRGTALFRRVIERGIATGEFRPVDVESTVICIVAPLLLAALWRHSFERVSDRRLDAEALGRAEIDLLRHGLAAEPSAEAGVDEGLR